MLGILVECLNCGLLWERISPAINPTVLTEDIQLFCPSCGSNAFRSAPKEKIRERRKNMKIPVTVPFYPDELTIETEIELGDASKRILPGVRLIVSWVDPDGAERGMVHFITEQDLTG